MQQTEFLPDAYGVVHYAKRPWTTNAERRMHHMERAGLVREWRETFGWLARMERLKPITQAIIVVQPHLKGKRSMDCDACMPAAKAAIDGLVDAGVLISDAPPNVVEIRYMAPILESKDGLTLFIYNRLGGETL